MRSRLKMDESVHEFSAAFAATPFHGRRIAKRGRGHPLDFAGIEKLSDGAVEPIVDVASRGLDRFRNVFDVGNR